MNIVFEGINGTGKTTIIKELEKIMKKNNQEVHCVSEIDNKSPLAETLNKMYNKDKKFLSLSEDINTIITETLILAADYQYMKEYTKELKGYKIYDRDIFTQNVYQKYFLEKKYGENNEFVLAWEKCLHFDNKKIDLVIYVEAPFEVCINRTCNRDNVNFSEKEKSILRDLYKLQKQYVESYCKSNNIKVIYINGCNDIQKNANKIYNDIIEINWEEKHDK